MKRGLNFGKWKIALGAVTLGATVTVSVAALRANGTLFDPSAIADRQLRQNQVLFPGETDAAKEETDGDDESGWEEEESADDNEEQPRLFDESKQPEAPSDMEQIMAQAQQNPQPTDLWEPIPEFTANENVIQQVNPARADEAGGADARIIVNVPNGQGNGNANAASGGDNRSYYSTPSDRQNSSDDGNNDRSSSESGGSSGERNNSSQNTPAVVTPVAPEKLPEQPKEPIVPEKEVESQQPKRHESAKDVNEVPEKHYHDNIITRNSNYMTPFPKEGIQADPSGKIQEVKVVSVQRKIPGIEQTFDENNYGIISGEPVTPPKIIKALDIYVCEKFADRPNDQQNWVVFDENKELIQFKDYPDYATGDFTVLCRARANKSQPWSDWTELTVPVYDQKLVFKTKRNGEWKEVRTLYLNEGETVNMMNACKLVPELQSYLTGEYGLGTTMFKDWSEGYDYYEEVDGNYILRDEIEETYDEQNITAKKNGGRRVFYAETIEKPQYMKVMLRKQGDEKFPEYHQSLEWIWWNYAPKKLGPTYLMELEVPEGIDTVCFMQGPEAKTLAKGSFPVQVDELKISSTVRSVDFTNLIVNQSFEVSPENPWLKASEDGTQLLDQEGRVLGEIDSLHKNSQKFIFYFRDANGNWKEVTSEVTKEGEIASLLFALEWAPYTEGATPTGILNGNFGLRGIMFRGWREGSPDGPFVSDEAVTVQKAGEPRRFYGEMTERPADLKIVLRKQNGRGGPEYHQTLEFIWWEEGERRYKDSLDVPEGVHDIMLRASGAKDATMAPGTPHEVGVLKLPSTVRSVDFTNLVVYDSFVVDDKNPWLHASEDGKQLLDSDDRVVGSTSDESPLKQKIVLHFKNSETQELSNTTLWKGKVESLSLMKYYTQAPELNQTGYLSGKYGIQYVFEGWKEGTDAKEFCYEDEIVIDPTGEQRDFYAVMKKKPQALKIKLIKKNDIYYQTLVGIWWDYYKDEIGEENVKNQHRDRFEVPVGVHGIQLGEVGGTADIDVLVIPYSLQSISFNDLKVQKGFEVDSNNKWFETSEDGTKLIDKETGEVLYTAPLGRPDREESLDSDK